jgi:hypothetical protein
MTKPCSKTKCVAMFWRRHPHCYQATPSDAAHTGQMKCPLSQRTTARRSAETFNRNAPRKACGGAQGDHAPRNASGGDAGGRRPRNGLGGRRGTTPPETVRGRRGTTPSETLWRGPEIGESAEGPKTKPPSPFPKPRAHGTLEPKSHSPHCLAPGAF